jgi:hypothetical protein
MIVGMRPPASGSATPEPDPDPVGVSTPSEPEPTRRALREARRRRRQLALFCALAIAVCLVLTVLIVDLARDRTPSSTASGAPLVAAARGPVERSVVPVPNVPGAAASEGGIR